MPPLANDTRLHPDLYPPELVRLLLLLLLLELRLLLQLLLQTPPSSFAQRLLVGLCLSLLQLLLLLLLLLLQVPCYCGTFQVHSPLVQGLEEWLVSCKV
jgi:hypothetical protein